MSAAKSLWLVALALLVAWPVADARAQLGFDLYRAGVQLTTEDVDLTRAAVREALESQEVGFTNTWSNPETGLNGEARLLDVFERNDSPCGTVYFTVTKQGRGIPYTLSFCKMEEEDRWGMLP